MQLILSDLQNPVYICFLEVIKVINFEIVLNYMYR